MSYWHCRKIKLFWFVNQQERLRLAIHVSFMEYTCDHILFYNETLVMIFQWCLYKGLCSWHWSSKTTRSQSGFHSKLLYGCWNNSHNEASEVGQCRQNTKSFWQLPCKIWKHKDTFNLETIPRLTAGMNSKQAFLHRKQSQLFDYRNSNLSSTTVYLEGYPLAGRWPLTILLNNWCLLKTWYQSWWL